MPEPISLLLLGGAKLFSMHAAHAAAAHAVTAQTAASVAGGAAAGAGGAHLTAFLFIGVATGTVLYAICRCLKRLVESGIFSSKQAERFKAKANSVDEKTQKRMLNDAEELCDKYGA
jgi:ABC-type enterochelin transport system permease subunit